MKKFLAMALTGAMCVGLLAGCSNGSSGTTSAPSGGSSASTPASSTAGADGAIKIGGIGPLTGSAATYGIATKQGAEIAVDEINALGVGPQGFGGKTTCLGLSIETAPTHVAGLPVAVNVSCHVTRRAAAEL